MAAPTTGQMIAAIASEWAAVATSKLFWDDTNTRLGIGDATPSYTLDVNGTIACTALRVNGNAFTVSGAPTLNDWFDQSVKQAASPAFAGVTIGSHHNSYASAYLAADLDLSDTPAWYEIGSGSETITEFFDVNGNYNTTTGRYTCPVTGYYLVEYLISMKAKSGIQTVVAVYTALGVGGGASRFGGSFYGSADYQFRGQGAFVVYCASGTALSAMVYAAEGGASQPTIIGGASETRMSFVLLGV